MAFAEAGRFEFDTALTGVDEDIDYGEERIKAYGFIGATLHILIYVERITALRIISLRKASRQEVKTYEEHLIKGW